MLFYDFTVGEKNYKLRLNTRNIVVLEKTLGCNPVAIFGADGETIPTVTQMVTILHTSLQQYQHSTTLEDAYNIFDEFLTENTITDFVSIIIGVYKVSGILRDTKETDEKNA